MDHITEKWGISSQLTGTLHPESSGRHWPRLLTILPFPPLLPLPREEVVPGF